MRKNEKFSLTVKIFREINSVLKTLLSRNFCKLPHARAHASVEIREIRSYTFLAKIPWK